MGQQHGRCPGTRSAVGIVLTAVLLTCAAGAAFAQSSAELVDRLPQVIPEPEDRVDQIIEGGVGLGRYAFDGTDDTSWFDSQFVRYTRSRPWVDTWRAEVGRQPNQVVVDGPRRQALRPRLSDAPHHRRPPTAPPPVCGPRGSRG